MRRTKTVRIGEVLDEFFSSSPTISRKIKEAKAPDLVAPIVGGAMAAHITKIECSNGKMTIFVGSSVARHELFMMREPLRQRLNEQLGTEVVKVLLVK